MGSLSLITGLVGLTLCRSSGQVASGEWACLGVFPLEIGGNGLITLTDLGGVTMELVWSVGTGLGGVKDRNPRRYLRSEWDLWK